MQPEDIKQAVALQRMVAVGATRPNWPSVLIAPNPEATEQPPPKPPALSEDENGHAAATSD
jgi:hypothetical protein